MLYVLAVGLVAFVVIGVLLLGFAGANKNQ
jgi:hypothetical protein